jgi:uncharacterized protein YdhG (YjbR/CyaY superfamily)
LRKPKNIQEYIESCPVEIRERLWTLHESILAAAPGAIESLKWSMPAYSYDKILVTFSAAKKHIGFYPMNAAIMAFAKQLAKYKTGEGSIQLPLSEPLPLKLINRIVKFRVKESKAGTLRWRE